MNSAYLLPPAEQLGQNTLKWKIKAAVQNIVSLMPSRLSVGAYYVIQRHLGGLKKFDILNGLSAGVEVCAEITRAGHKPDGKTFFETGTGRVPLMPLAYWLMGAGKVITLDLNPYFSPELLKNSLEYISCNNEKVLQIFGSSMKPERLGALLKFYKDKPFSPANFFDFCSIDYIAPADSSNTGLKPGSIDFYTSHAVFEHIPPNTLKSIINEANRITKHDGLFINRIDYTDHFSLSDKSISSLNFLQFSDSQWDKYAGNRYMYMNRLRHDDYINLLESSGHKILRMFTYENPTVLEMIKNGQLELDEKFKSKPDKVLATLGAVIVSSKNV